MRVPEVLRHENYVDEDVVGGNDDLPSGLSCQRSSEEVGRVAQTPFGQEVEAQPAGRLQTVVLVDLRQLGEQPRRDAETAQGRGHESQRRWDARLEGRREEGQEGARWFAVIR